MSLGYLGQLRWRVRTGDDFVDASDVRVAVEMIFDSIFEDVPQGSEAAARSPLGLVIAGKRTKLIADPKFINGWRSTSSDIDCDVGPHDKLLGFVVEEVAVAAERAWAIGVQAVRPASLTPGFSFEAFAEAGNREALCRELETVLGERERAHPCPRVAFHEAMKELKAAGHDLWSVTDETWGPDYIEARKGAGLRITRFANDDERGVESKISVAFKPRST